jgi:hypothetical protein
MPIEQITLFSDGENKNIHLYIERDTTVDDWIIEHHYLHSTPAGAVIRMCFKDRAHRIIGRMMWGRPTSRKLDQEKILELTRMCFISDTPPFVESQCLAMARKHIRRHHNGTKGIIAYSSTGAGHEGTIYAADGWFKLGGGRGGNWETRDNRTNRDLSLKHRWVRSP